MRVVKLLLLGLCAYLITIIALFPAEPVLNRLKPQIQPVRISDPGGSLVAGRAARVVYDDPAFPIEASNVSWRLAPQKLLTGSAGADFEFDAYGGHGAGDFERRLNGDLRLSDLAYRAPAKGLEALLPLPIAQFDGELEAFINELTIRNQLLDKMRGQIVWRSAQLSAPVKAALGEVSIDIVPLEELQHRAVIKATGGDVTVDGNIDIHQNGDFQTSLTIVPGETASPELLNSLRGMGRADSRGQIKIQQKGNVNRLM